jgi:hypothetical protein
LPNFAKETVVPKFSPDQPLDGSPTAAEIFHVFRSTTMASIEGSRLLLDECADLRAELVTVHSLHSEGDGDALFSARQQGRILELREAANEMKILQSSLPGSQQAKGGKGDEH